MRLMNRSRVASTLALLAACCLMQTTNAFGHSPVKEYVPSLKGTFAIFSLEIPGRGRVWGASAVELDDDSPLKRIFLNSPGEFITHLDGRPATSFRELDNHYDWTTVHWIEPANGRVHRDKIYIPR